MVALLPLGRVQWGFPRPQFPCGAHSLPTSPRDIDKVDDLMSDITEQQDIAQQISDAISKPVGFGDDVDEVRRGRAPSFREGWILRGLGG